MAQDCAINNAELITHLIRREIERHPLHQKKAKYRALLQEVMNWATSPAGFDEFAEGIIPKIEEALK